MKICVNIKCKENIDSDSKFCKYCGTDQNLKGIKVIKHDGKTAWNTIKEFNLFKRGSVRDVAKFTIDKIYEYDKFERIQELFDSKITPSFIKIKKSDGVFNVLNSVFCTPLSIQYNDNTKTFVDKEYNIPIFEPFIESCRLTRQWSGIVEAEANTNYLWALIEIVNKNYKDIFKIEYSEAPLYFKKKC